MRRVVPKVECKVLHNSHISSRARIPTRYLSAFDCGNPSFGARRIPSGGIQVGLPTLIFVLGNGVPVAELLGVGL
ncbi:hypothetical protein HETIRDRAFT_414561 [Heterobasidion irregulare TC 32-1]|uniref:Uncharacterized protein n=1 Tax=Heterobasidion irregulare (strain TC 32-1) TaxID=747525 RepID=W4KIL4_HETIT|nr:uncharacterized protein HETIRDRAFT_414561 [Heterobasidion irregulare TC 32-1]ETW85549.1 hypothetical protein HETIRDRAFT_414561 [Heterobasidion irregulare TC 32-1]